LCRVNGYLLDHIRGFKFLAEPRTFCHSLLAIIAQKEHFVREMIDRSPLLEKDPEVGSESTSLGYYGPGITLSWSGIECFVPGPSRDDDENDAKHGDAAAAKTRTKLKRVLVNISGHVAPGEMLAIMGPSGRYRIAL